MITGILKKNTFKRKQNNCTNIHIHELGVIYGTII